MQFIKHITLFEGKIIYCVSVAATYLTPDMMRTGAWDSRRDGL